MTETTFKFPELKVHNLGGLRFYETPDGLKYPSITTVLGAQPDKKKSLYEWRQRVGEEEANKISSKAARRGSAFHYMVEDYLNGNHSFEEGKEAVHKERNFLAWSMFNEMRPYIDKEIYSTILQEKNMYSDKYKVAGRCDFIGVHNGKLSVVDFKTSNYIKKEEWIDDYFIQCSAYASMFEEMTGTNVDNLVIMMAAETGEVKTFEKKTKDYLPKLQSIMETWYDTLFDKANIK